MLITFLFEPLLGVTLFSTLDLRNTLTHLVRTWTDWCSCCCSSISVQQATGLFKSFRVFFIIEWHPSGVWCLCFSQFNFALTYSPIPQNIRPHVPSRQHAQILTPNTPPPAKTVLLPDRWHETLNSPSQPYFLMVQIIPLSNWPKIPPAASNIRLFSAMRIWISKI